MFVEGLVWSRDCLCSALRVLRSSSLAVFCIGSGIHAVGPLGVSRTSSVSDCRCVALRCSALLVSAHDFWGMIRPAIVLCCADIRACASGMHGRS